MKRWLALWLAGLLFGGSGCALNESLHRNVCSSFTTPADATREPEPIAPQALKVPPGFEPRVAKVASVEKPLAIEKPIELPPLLPKQEGIHQATFAPPALGTAESDLANESRPFRFGVPSGPEPEMPSDLPALTPSQVTLSIGPLQVQRSPDSPIVLAGLNARVRRPFFLDAPIASEPIVANPAPALVPQGEIEIVQLGPAQHLATVILPFVQLQAPATTPSLMEPIPQIILIPSPDEP